MKILTVRTDKPEAELGLYDNGHLTGHITWLAHRQLAETLLSQITELLAQNGLDFHSLEGLVYYAGPGSFTGLRIGASVGNALAYGLQIPVIASKGEDWITTGLAGLPDRQLDVYALPEYGADVHITQPKSLPKTD